MDNKKFSDIFNLSLKEFEDELRYQYSKEKKSLTADKAAPEKTSDGYGSCKQYLLALVSDIELVLKWNVSEYASFNKSGMLEKKRLDIDELVRKIDMRIAQLERKEKLEKAEKDNLDITSCGDTEEELTKFVSEFRPQFGFSDYYNLLYSIAFLCKYCSQPEVTCTDNASKEHQLFSGLSPFSLETMFVFRIIELISECNRDIKLDTKERIISTASEYVKRTCRRAFSKDNWAEEDKKHLLLTIQLVAFVKVLIDPSIQKESAFQLSISMISLECANICYQKSDYEDGIRFSLKALMANNSADRQDAFNVLGLCAINNKQYQLAYNAYYSWTNRRMVKLDSSINDYVKKMLEDELKGPIEEEWRKEKPEAVALMYGNFAYVCGTMYDLIETSAQRDELIGLAKHFIMLAIESDPKSASYYCSAGTIYYDAKENEDALKYYKQYYDKTIKLVDKVTALRSILQLYQKIPDKFSNKDYEAIETDFLHRYQQLSSENDGIENEEITRARDLYVLLSECARLSDESKKLKRVLLEVDNEIRDILSILRWALNTPLTFDLHLELLKEANEPLVVFNMGTVKKNTKSQKGGQRSKEIAYYTTLKNLQYLFSETPQENGNTINCLTMMHARYMNDPDEGLILLQKFQEYLPKAPEIMRNELYDQKFIFLKSFTSLVDQLNMWTLYGSDRDNGSDCNGCCICIAPETFGMVSDRQNKQTNTLSFDNDDYHLYSVAYIEGEKIFVNGDRSTEIEIHFKRLKKLIAKISKGLAGGSSTDTDIVTTCLVRMLEKAMYLFKDKAYHLEAESRLIISRDIKDRSEIRKTLQEPPKLFINPMFQVFPEKILLGPKVENPDYWIPHLQYELSKICEKWPPDSSRIYKPIVRISGINIR